MNALNIETSQQFQSFEPGQEITGAVSWKLDRKPEAIELHLVWSTHGKGTEDAELVEVFDFDHPMLEETRPFRFQLPLAPYSFSGKLISLVWALELVAKPSKASARLELVIAPGGQEVRLDALPQNARSKPILSWNTPR